MVSSRMFRANHPSRVAILLNSSVGNKSGLLMDSVVMTDNLATIMELAIEEVIGWLPMIDVDMALKHTLGLKD